MMDPKIFIAVFYLILYSSFSTAELSIGDAVKVDKALSTGKELLSLMDAVAKSIDSENAGKKVQAALQAFQHLSTVASSLGFAGALVGFIFAFIPKYDPKHEFIKEQLAEVNRKLDSLSLQMSALLTQMEWSTYASVYGIDENKIKNSQAKLDELMANAPLAKTTEEKMRLAEQFTTFYENTGTEGSLFNFHRFLTDTNPQSLNKNLLNLVIEKSNGNFNILTQYSSYFTLLVVSGLQMNLQYYILKGLDSAAKIEQAVTQLSEIQTAIQDSLIQCADDFETWAKMDVEKIGTEPFSDNKKLASNIKEHLDEKFSWYEWSVIVHDRKEEQRTHGTSIDLTVQDKAIHLIHRENGFHVDGNIKRQMAHEWDSKGVLCSKKTQQWPSIFTSRVMKHVKFIHKSSGGDQREDSGHVELTCEKDDRKTTSTYTIYMKSAHFVEKPDACFELKCLHGECRQIKDTAQGLCKCHLMFYGRICEKSIQNDIDFVDIEEQLNDMSLHAVPDLTAIYFSIKEINEAIETKLNSLQQDIQWTQVFVKYNDMITNFRYLVTIHEHLKNGIMPQDLYVSEVETHFTQAGTFLQMLFTFDMMMQGNGGFGDDLDILEIFRITILDKEKQPDDPFECSESYANKVDDFLSFLFGLEKESLLAWIEYLLITDKLKDTVNVNDLPDNPKNTAKTILFSPPLNYWKYLKLLFNLYVTGQSKHFNESGCGSLKADNLSNAYCEKRYHSTDQQKIKVKCTDSYKPYPETVQCSKGNWSHLLVCYTDPLRGSTTCKSESGASKCTASCQIGWTLSDGQRNESYQCQGFPCMSKVAHLAVSAHDLDQMNIYERLRTFMGLFWTFWGVLGTFWGPYGGTTLAPQNARENPECTNQPCPSFNPKDCDRCISDSACGPDELCLSGRCGKCTTDSVCGNSEVCRDGVCVDGCLDFYCGLNSKCSTSFHRRRCTCESPWIRYEEDDLSQGCRYKNLEWRWFHERGSGHLVRTRTGKAVCRLRAHDDISHWHGGWVWQNFWGTWKCYIQNYGGAQHQTHTFQVLVDPCSGGGTRWDPVEGSHPKTVPVSPFISSFQVSPSISIGFTVWICSSRDKGEPGQYSYRSGGSGCNPVIACHIGWGNCYSTNNYYTLTHTPCI